MTRTLPIAITVALLAGCGGSDLGFDTTPTPTSTAAATATPTVTANARLVAGCPGGGPTVEIIDGTPYVILAAPCTPTATPAAALGPTSD